MTDDDITALAAAIDASPDPLHGDRTPAVQALVLLGLRALPAVLPLLVADADITRLHAQRVFEGVSRIHTHLTTDKGRRDAAWAALWQANGSYDWSAPAAHREAARERWSTWLPRSLCNRQPRLRRNATSPSDIGHPGRRTSPCGCRSGNAGSGPAAARATSLPSAPGPSCRGRRRWSAWAR